MNRGILLISIGHTSYARWAHNMAVSIRAVSPTLPIHVLTDGNFPDEPFHTEVVDRVIKMDRDDCYLDGKLYPARAKLSMYKYSEFDDTIYLDVDGVVIKDLNPLFDECTGYFQIQVNGVSTKDHDNLDASLWVKPEQIFKKYKLKEDAVIPGTNSSFMYFKKGKSAETLFNKALKNLANPIAIRELRYQWGHSNTQPDELYMNIALAQVGLVPDIKPVLYLRKRGFGSGHNDLETIQRGFYVIGCWGDATYNHHEISGTGDTRSGLYNKVCIDAYKKVYGNVTFSDSFHKLIKGKVYAKPIK
jgi:hypothetical protein